MEITLRLLFSVAVLHALAFSTIMCKIDVEREKRELSENDLKVRNLIQSGEGFLAGEDTPVWFAGYSDEKKQPIYTTETPGIHGPKTIKRAIDYWKAGKFRYLPSRPRRSIDESASDIMKNLENWNNETLSKLSTTNDGEKSVEKRGTNDVYHPSILIVMYYEQWNNFPAPLLDKIIYALAFWNAVDLQLRHIKDPHVRLRIAGIVIVRSESAVPYFKEHLNGYGNLDVNKGFGSMMNYWLDLSENNNNNFPMGSYDIVATMTSVDFAGDSYGSVLSGPPCFGPNNRTITGLLLYDNLAFDGIQLAVQGISKILGAKNNDDCPSEQDNVMSSDYSKIGRKWSQCTLNQISTTLKNKGSCLREAKEFHRPGKPVEAILPGKLVPGLLYCRANSYVDNPIIERNTGENQCRSLWCKNYGFLKLWAAFPVLDGTTCDGTKVCLDGKCVSETIISS